MPRRPSSLVRVPFRGNAGGAHGEGAIAIEIESIKEKMRGAPPPLSLTLSSLHWLAKGRFHNYLVYRVSIRFSYSKFYSRPLVVAPYLFHDLLSLKIKIPI